MSDDEKRERIVDAVQSLVVKNGVQGATTARIAATVGVSEPTLYRTFRNRKEMLLAAADKIWQERHDQIEAFEPADAMDHLRRICEFHTVGIQKTRCVRFLTELSVAPEGDGLQEHIRGLMLDDVHHLAEVVNEGKAQGCIRPEVDPWETAWRIMAVYWLEAMARLHGLEDQVLSGFSSRRFQNVLGEIAAEPVPSRADG
jgi:AcrR family transcriptional regulator